MSAYDPKRTSGQNISPLTAVFAVASDPVKLGLVASYNRPGGNATGMNVLTATLEAKRLGLIHELVPQAATIDFLTNPRFASAEGQVHDVQEAARALALKVRVLPASTEKDIVAAFGTISGEASWRSRSRLGSSKWRTWPPEHGHLAAHLGLNVSLSLQQRVDEVIE
ncbi:MAG: ABC transporter substrate binding protein [Pseudolabrys sp.]